MPPALFADEVKENEPVNTKLLGENLLVNRVGWAVFVIKDRCLDYGFIQKTRVLHRRYDYVLVSREDVPVGRWVVMRHYDGAKQPNDG